MSLFRTLDRTTCTSAVSNTSTARPFLSFLCPALNQATPKRRFAKGAVGRAPKLNPSSADYMDRFFIQALVRAGSCPEHARKISTLQDNVPYKSEHHKTRRKKTRQSYERKESLSTGERSGPFKKMRQFAKEELMALVDYYGIELDTRPEPKVVEDYGLLIWNVGDDHTPYPFRNEGDRVYVERIKELLEHDNSSHDDIFAAYKSLPSPGVAYLDLETIRKLLHHLSVVERASPIAMQRFLSILDDMKNAHIHITRSEWTSAIYLAGRFMGRVTDEEVHTALHIWNDMEKRAKIKGGIVTLNVLFDVAVKAGKFALAEVFIKEITARKLKIHRHFRVSLMYYYGVMRNGEAVRRTYQQLVEAGDVIDTVVLNAVIAALIRAGEPSSAEHVFERMKRLHSADLRSGIKVQQYKDGSWRDRRKLGLELTYRSQRLDKTEDAEKSEERQTNGPVAPDSRTYSLIIRHHATKAGNIDRVNELLREMHYNAVPLEGVIFITIFQGFHSFAGVRYSSWTQTKLEKTWTQYLKAVEDKMDRTWISSMAVVTALKAFRTCTDAERTLKAWEEVRQLWHPTDEELQHVYKVLRRLVPQHGFFDMERL